MQLSRFLLVQFGLWVNMGAVRVNGSTSGYVELAAPAVAGSVVMTLPATTGTLAVQGEAYGRSATATVATSQTTTSTSFTDLTTAGPAVTVTTGTKAFVIISSYLYNSTDARAATMSFAVSGATTVAAADEVALEMNMTGVNKPPARMSAGYIITGLTAGSNVFTAKYRVSANTGTFQNRNISVIDMGS